MNRAVYFLLYVFFAVLLVGCNSQQDSESNKEVQRNGDPQKLRLAWTSDAGFPSPFAFSSRGPAGYLRVSYLYDTLTWKDQQGIIPWLAQSWETSDNGRTYTVHLREGVKWQDGKELTASDVKFTFAYLSQHGFAWGDTSMIDDVEVKNNTTVVFHLNKLFSPFVEEVMGVIPIIPEYIWANVKDPKSFRGEGAAVGTGPYILKSYNQESGQHLFTANADYFKGKPVVEEISFITANNTVLSLKNKDIDAVLSNNYKDVQELKKAGYQVMESNPHGSIVRMVFNLDHPLLGLKDLRHAITYALDRAAIAEKVLGGNGAVGNAGVIPPGSPWYNPNVRAYDYHLEKANGILDSLGFEDRNQDGIRETRDGTNRNSGNGVKVKPEKSGLFLTVTATGALKRLRLSYIQQVLLLVLKREFIFGLLWNRFRIPMCYIE
ncbi:MULTISPECIES: ABC transporter substrate-binding protein [unclassified Paenibacillus]|uniref:ABC transporter substrate-binding protein n=1 Tax=unclassified Paenibacillus TaxID=185978 RepID=UPI001B590318|nr:MULTISPECIES: ABC transporter substrate-binding protein [unclassified Paenibacillus]MBP1154882.1 ABC-type transport system substrate-binding protein [Paenibacillus sp. PvP091]MBP1169734.1 ABC-type transport system substrate-binding protein [Paenibacillus sp. PvR098]MBP2440762.1 ABC-type transport system substrate-binding protein [Paenibacillus sp. PvP052]